MPVLPIYNHDLALPQAHITQMSLCSEAGLGRWRLHTRVLVAELRALAGAHSPPPANSSSKTATSLSHLRAPFRLTGCASISLWKSSIRVRIILRRRLRLDEGRRHGPKCDGTLSVGFRNLLSQFEPLRIPVAGAERDILAREPSANAVLESTKDCQRR